MTKTLDDKARRFRDLHDRDGIFIMPNAWDAGSAAILAGVGFEAIGTTSAGVNFKNATTDYDYHVPRDDMLAEYGAIAKAVDVPVNGDLENGYGDRPEDVAETIRQSIRHGMVGGGIEDHTGDPQAPLYDIELAADRIRAAKETAEQSGIAYTLTARAECYFFDHPDPFRESVRRLNRYREAGADCLYAPGTRDLETIAALVREVDGPVNVVMGLAGATYSVDELANVGVKRISVGGALARAALGTIRDAAREMKDEGTFGFAKTAIPDDELDRFFASRRQGRS